MITQDTFDMGLDNFRAKRKAYNLTTSLTCSDVIPPPPLLLLLLLLR